MKRKHIAVGACLGVALTAVGLFAIPANGTIGEPPEAIFSAVTPADPVVIDPEDALRQSALVAQEDRRLQDVRTVTTLARWQNRSQKAPYRLATPAGFTLVLTSRSAAYTLSDLLKLQPQTLVRLSDGSYLLREHIVVLSGAELNLAPAAGLTLRLASSAEGLVSIVSMGGRMTIVGTDAHRVTITSWNEHAAANDKETADGRAYIRALGGQLQLSYVSIEDLGFWSGRTGGLSLTGTDRPNTGSLDVDTLTGDAPAPTLPGGDGSVGGTQILPTGDLPTSAYSPGSSPVDTSLSFVSARIDNTTVTGNAFGLFVSGADGVLVDSSTFTHSQITGVDFHRFVRSSVIQRTASNYSGGDGFSLGRATQGVQINQSVAIGNADDGFSISGEPLSDGPSAVGSPTQKYGNNSISNSTATGNGHYGIAIRDGFNMTVANNQVAGSKMGIVVLDNATNVSVTGNQINSVASHGVALLDGVTDSTVSGNLVNDGPIYLRNAWARVQGNTVLNASGHAVSVVGSANGTVIAHNVVAGYGSSAIDIARAQDDAVVQTGNSAEGWRDTTSLITEVKRALLQPMTLLWLAIAILVIGSLVRGVGREKPAPGTHPYAHQNGHLRLGAA
jgi:parallel beta-helix repeat protein